MMKTLRTIIVDDEPLARDVLRAKLSKISSIDIICECKNGREAIEQTLALSPDLLFLDIQMPGIDGFGVIKNLQSDVVPLVIFTTAYEEYALNAFDVHAVDYILKPIDSERIERAVNRALQLYSTSQSNNHKTRIISAIDVLSEKTLQQHEFEQASENKDVKIVVKDRDDITLLEQSSIAWIDAAGDYVCLHVDGVTHIKRCTLKSLLNVLDESMFKQVHRSTIVNLNYIKKIIPHTKGEYFLQLGEFDQVKVSRNYRAVIKSFLNEM